MENLNSKKFFLYLLVCSIALSALMGIWAIVSGEFGELQGKILLTTLTVVGTSILGLACGAFLESPRSENSSYKVVPVVGIICAVVAAIASFWLIWLNSRIDFNWIWKLFFVSLIFGFSLAQLSLLSLAKLAKRFVWSLTTAFVVIFILDTIVSAIIVFELEGSDGFVLRVIGVLSVVAAALTVMIPLFHRLSRTEFAEFDTPNITVIDAEINRLKTQIARLEKQKEDIFNADMKN